MKRHCTNCVQRAELRPTGKSYGEPQLYCNVCKAEYYLSDGKISIEKPYKWPAAKKTKTQEWKIIKGHWRLVKS